MRASAGTFISRMEWKQIVCVTCGHLERDVHRIPAGVGWQRTREALQRTSAKAYRSTFAELEYAGPDAPGAHPPWSPADSLLAGQDRIEPLPIRLG